MSFDRSLLNRLCRLARLRIAEDDAVRLTEELRKVISTLDLLAAFDPNESTAPDAEEGRAMRLRADEIDRILPPEEALAGAPRRIGGEFAVPGLLPTTEGGTDRSDGERS